MKKIRPVVLAILGVSVVLALATGCFRPAAPDVTPTPGEGGEEATPGGGDLQATAIANSTRAAQTTEAQTAEAEPAEGEEPEATEEEEGQEPTEAPTEPPATPTSEPAAATATPTIPPPTPAPTFTPMPSGETTHVVQPGENLFRIALRYGTTVDAIAQANGIADESQIYVGQELIIPAGTGEVTQPPATGTTYVVQPGDNLFRIALRYNLSHQRLAEYNGITDPSSIYVGQVLQIPPQ